MLMQMETKNFIKKDKKILNSTTPLAYGCNRLKRLESIRDNGKSIRDTNDI